MNTQSIEIDGREYEIKFGFGANYILTKKWKLKALSKVGERIARSLNFKEGKEPEVDQLAVLGDLIHAGILNFDKGVKITRDDCVDWVLNNPHAVGTIFELYAESNPKSPDPEKNVNRVK